MERDGDDLRAQRAQVVDDGGDAPRLPDPDRDGQDRPDAPAYAQQSMVLVPLDTPGLRSCARCRCSATWTSEGHGELRSTTCACRQRTDRRRGRRLPDRPGAARPRTHPPLHARDRRGRAGAGADVQARATARRRSASRSPRARTCRDWIAEARIELEMLRLLVLKTAWLIDTVGNKSARTEIAAIKVAAPNMALKIIDRAIQVHGGGGVSRRLPARLHVRAHAHAPARRRAGRGAQALDRPARAAPPRRRDGGLVS